MSACLFPLSIHLRIGLVLCAGSLYGCQPAGTTEPQPSPVTTQKVTPSTILTISARQSVADAYNREFANAPLMNWSGNVNECKEGTSSAAYIAAQLSRINYFRAMAGIEGRVTFVDSLSRKAQKAVLLLGNAGLLTHVVQKNWKCYSVEGDWAAAHSNLAQTGGTNPDFITQYIADDGTNNSDVGHRRWLLSPAITAMGTGNLLHPKTKTAYNALPIAVDPFATEQDRMKTRDEYICWPVAGYNPYQLVFARWSFHLPGADFSDSSVRVTKAGKVLTSTIVSDDDTDYGDNALIWQMDAVGKPGSDQVYEVSIQNVRKGGQIRSFAYKVTVIDPLTK